MAKAYSKIIKGKIKENDKMRRKFFADDNIQAIFLSLDGDSGAFAVEFTLETGWYIDYSKFRGRMELIYAAHDYAPFVAAIECSSHFSVETEVYTIDKGDLITPQGEEPFYVVPGTRTGMKYV